MTKILKKIKSLVARLKNAKKKDNKIELLELCRELKKMDLKFMVEKNNNDFIIKVANEKEKNATQ